MIPAGRMRAVKKRIASSGGSSPSGMTKNADQFAGNGGMFQMTGWTPDVESTVTADGLVVSMANGAIVARGTGENTVLGSSNSNVSLRRNGVEVATTSWSGNNPASWVIGYSGPISSGDVFTLWAGNGGDAYTFMVAGSTVKHLPNIFAPSSAFRTTSFTITGSMTKVTFNTVDPMVPSTVLVNGGIQVNYTGAVKVILDCTTQAAASGYTQTFKPYVNDADTSGATANVKTRGVRHAEWTINVNSGDVVSLWAGRSGTSSIDANAQLQIAAP